MSRQHASPILIEGGSARTLLPLSLDGTGDAVSEAAMQELIQAHPSCLPIREIDPVFADPVPICTELNTPAGPIDNFMVTAGGLPVLVECKLWRNPEMRRQVVSQILDYAKEFTRWTSSDLQREASRRLGRPGNVLLEKVRAAGHEVEESDFNDALTLNLRRGRFLLLIVGDGIREGVEAITEYLQAHAGLHFTLGLVELPIFQLEPGRLIVAPRVLTRTYLIRREVVATPAGYQVQDEESSPSEAEQDPSIELRKAFFKDFFSGFCLSDPEQPLPSPTANGYVYLYLPAPKSSCWIAVVPRRDQVAIWVASGRDTIGDEALQRVLGSWDEFKDAIGGSARKKSWKNDASRFWLEDSSPGKPLEPGDSRKQCIEWLRERLDTFVSVLRPRIRDAVLAIENGA